MTRRRSPPSRHLATALAVAAVVLVGGPAAAEAPTQHQRALARAVASPAADEAELRVVPADQGRVDLVAFSTAPPRVVADGLAEAFRRRQPLTGGFEVVAHALVRPQRWFFTITLGSEQLVCEVAAADRGSRIAIWGDPAPTEPDERAP